MRWSRVNIVVDGGGIVRVGGCMNVIVVGWVLGVALISVYFV